ncbi:MAG: YkgJ family cysteine cluster protein [Candidatus Omnitrophota bacterium]
MISQLKQFVPSSVCLKCEGCCRFHLNDSTWRPKVGQEEVQEGVDTQGYLKTVSRNNQHQCVYFKQADYTCGIYAQRPFECAVYPFVLSQSARGLEVYVHLACPYVQENEVSPQLQDYGAYLKEFFTLPQTKVFLKENSRLLHDYSVFKDELKLVFTIGG